MALKAVRDSALLVLAAALIVSGQTASVANTGIEAYRQGEYGTAERLLTQALAIESNNTPDRVRVLNALGAVYRSEEKFDEAEQCYAQALAIGDPTAEATLKHNLARLRYERGHLTEARELASEALRLKHAANAVNVAETENLLGLIAESEGDWKDSMVRYESALRDARTPEERTESLANLGNAKRNQNRLGEAESDLRLALEQMKARDVRPEVRAAALSNLGMVMRAQGAATEAKALFEQARDIWMRCAGTGSSGYAVTLSNLGLLAEDEHKLKLARSLYEQSLTIHLRVLGASAAATSMDRIRLGMLLCRTRHQQQGRELLEAVLESSRNEAAIAMARGNLGVLALRSGNWASAGTLLNSAVEGLRRWTAEPDSGRAGIFDAYAVVLRRNGEYAQAEQVETEATGMRVRVALSKGSKNTA